MMEKIVNANLNNRAMQIETLIRRYFDGCNDGDLEKMQSCFIQDAVHYFPPGMYNGPFRGAAVISENFKRMVETIGSYWTIDTLLVEPVSWQAVMEWTHFKTKQATILRGIEIYAFDRGSGLIREIRAYYASPQAADLSRQELQGFDYSNRGFPAAPPPGVR